jgi:hypothetical protein
MVRRERGRSYLDVLASSRTAALATPLPILKRHVEESSDFGGIIEPTFGGFYRIDDLGKIREHLDELCADQARAVLSGNALSVLETTFARRDR